MLHRVNKINVQNNNKMFVNEFLVKTIKAFVNVWQKLASDSDSDSDLLSS